MSIEEIGSRPRRDADEFSSKVEEVIDALQSEQQIVTVTGPAGCGKTTLIQKVVSRIDCKTCIVSYTAQAARMLQRRDLRATTIHKLIYRPAGRKAKEIAELKRQLAELKEGDAAGETTKLRLERELAELLEPDHVLNKDSDLKDAALCIIDEVSMVGEKLGRDLTSFGVKCSLSVTRTNWDRLGPSPTLTSSRLTSSSPKSFGNRKAAASSTWPHECGHTR